MPRLSIPRRTGLPVTTRAAALAILLLVLPACDSSDPIQDPSVASGTYTAERLAYVPDNVNLGTIDLLATRFEGPVVLELLSGGAYLLRYRPVGGSELLLTGEFRVTEDEVRFTGREADAAAYRRFLLEPTFALDRTTGALVGAIDRVVNTSRYPDLYTGVGEVQGEVRLRFVR